MNFISIENLDLIDAAAEEFIRQMEGAAIFAFQGKMGVGKTTFIKAICQKLGVMDVINSPTFAIINEYHSEARGEDIYHFDFYRIRDLQEACNIGVSDYFDSGALCFIEWPEKIEPLLPEHTVWVNLEEQEDGSRRIEWNADGAKGAE
ncbi:MAG: tRNA (adenosine(37)-N6)-threonylcarbamoyltransferase complex ATPase subunit type 1 TsaE [Candidatus Azobacteroides sp.]|nr:tRNA (adenosine(37)-N6)-threonylcarbamoyltransferase complex ATPase subunit type 1 TsaE [Candidatus Azobacteroides sp.]